MANLKDTIVLGNLTVTGTVNASSILSTGGNAFNTIVVPNQSQLTIDYNNSSDDKFLIYLDDGTVTLQSTDGGFSSGTLQFVMDGVYSSQLFVNNINSPGYSGDLYIGSGTESLILAAGSIRASSSLLPNSTSLNLGGSSNAWSNLYLSSSIIKGSYTLTLPSKTGTIALTSDCKNPTDYYWANVPISSTSSTDTRPTFKAAYAQTMGVERIQPYNQSGVVEIGDPELDDSSSPGEIRLSAFDGIQLKTANINTDSNIDLIIGGHEDGDYRGYINLNGPVRFTQDTRTYFSSNGYLTWRSNGIEMSGDDAYGRIYPKTTNCGYLGQSSQCWYYGYINNIKSNYIYASNIINKDNVNNSGTLGSPSSKWSVIWTQYINAYQVRSLGSTTATSVSSGGYIGSSGQPFGYGYFTNLYKGGSSVSTSDIRLKNNIKQTDLEALPIISNLHILNYQLNRFTKEQSDLKKRKQKALATMRELPKTKENRELRKQLQELISKPNHQNVLDIGISAQELEELLPQKHRDTFILKESTGEFADQRYIKDDNLIYLAFKAIQEQQQLIDNLQEQIKELRQWIPN